MEKEGSRDPHREYFPNIGDRSRARHGILAIFLVTLLLYGLTYRAGPLPDGALGGNTDRAILQEALFRRTAAAVRALTGPIEPRHSLSPPGRGEGEGQDSREGGGATSLSPPVPGGSPFKGEGAAAQPQTEALVDAWAPLVVVPPGGPVLHAPLYALGLALGGGRVEVARSAARLTNLILAALAVAMVYRLGRVLGVGPLVATLTAFLAAAGTALLPSAGWATARPASALGAAAAVCGALSYRRYPRMQSMVTAVVGLMLAILARPANVLFAAVVLGYVFADPFRRLRAQGLRLSMFVLPTAAAAAAAVWYNHSRFGSWLDGGPRGLMPASFGWYGSGAFDPLVLLGLVTTLGLAVLRRREGIGLLAMVLAVGLEAILWPRHLVGMHAQVWAGLEAVPLMAAAAGVFLMRTNRWQAATLVAGFAVIGIAVNLRQALLRDAAGRILLWWGDWPVVGAILLALVVFLVGWTVRWAARHDRETATY